MSQVSVSRRGVERIRGGHLWIYRSDVKKAAADSGEVVEVCDKQGKILGKAFYSKESQITIRLLTTRDEAIDEAFWRRRLESALASRQPILPRSNAYRWVHGESDGIPSLVVDRYGDHIVMQTLSRGTERLKDTFVRLIADILKPAGILERNDVKVRALEGLSLLKNVLHGEVPPVVRVKEEGVEFQANLWEGQKTGLFLDQRENHFAAARYARGRGLDVFSYDGGFTLHLARKCDQVLSADVSAEALARLRANAEANGLSNVETIEANAFDLLRDLADRGEPFDTIVLYPPAFAKNRAAIPQAARGYKEINLRALKLLRPGGHLVTSTCSYHIKEGDFLDILTSAAVDVGARVVLREKRMQSRDHPVLLTMPETHYLKCLVLQKL
jgi:23S rRNA (cytosine1962-C5)-methyltransferase